MKYIYPIYLFYTSILFYLYPEEILFEFLIIKVRVLNVLTTLRRFKFKALTPPFYIFSFKKIIKYVQS